MTAIVTENSQLNSTISTIFSVPADAAKKHLFFSISAINLGVNDALLWLWGEDFGVSPNLIANAVQVPLTDYLPTRSAWQLEHKISIPPNGKIRGYAVIQKEANIDWHTWANWFVPENWDNPSLQFVAEDIINISGTYAEVK